MYRSTMLYIIARKMLFRKRLYSKKGTFMNDKLKRIYIPMTETGFYILYCLQEENHGYNIGLQVKQMTGGEINISPGTMYGTLSKMEQDGLIYLVKVEEKRKFYHITELGYEILDLELARIERLYKNSKGEIIGGTENE